MNAQSKPVDPLRIFIQAERFRRSEEYLRASSPQAMAATMVPAMVLSAFASELYLKCLLRLDSKPIPPTHDLRALFKKLAPDTRRAIEMRWDVAQQSPQAQQMRAAILQLTGDVVPSDLNSALKLGAHGFRELRYIHEQIETNSTFQLSDLPRILRSVVVALRPWWANLGPGIPSQIEPKPSPAARHRS